MILQNAPTGGWEAITKVKLPQGEEYEQAGLIAHNSDATFAKLVLMDIPGLGWRVEFGQNLDGQPIFDEALDRSGPLPGDDQRQPGSGCKLASTGQFLIGVVVGRRRQTWTPFGRSRCADHASASASPPTTATGRRRRSTSSGSRPKAVEEPCKTGATPEAGYRMLFDGTRRP